MRFNNDAAEVGSAQALAADDQAILAAYEAEIVAAAMTPATPESARSDFETRAPARGKKTPK